jgi:hypothetical protein
VSTATKAEKGLKKAEQESPEAVILGYLRPGITSSMVHTELLMRLSARDIT